MSVKQIIKSIVPKSAWEKARSLKAAMKASKASRIQRQRFMRWISLDTSTDKARVETRLAFDIHRLEKGLSHVNFRCGFGKGVLSEVSKRMVLLEKADKNYKTNPLYQQGLSVLHEYQHRHVDVNYDLTSVKAIFPKHIWESALDYEPNASSEAGSFIMNSSVKADNLSKGFVQLA